MSSDRGTVAERAAATSVMTDMGARGRGDDAPAAEAMMTAKITMPSIAAWGIWLFMGAATLWLVLRYGRDIPVAEDWFLVRPLTNNEPDLLGWAWVQVNEHRVALTKLIYLAVLELGGGDFRAGMFFNVAVLTGVAAALMFAARRLRGYTRISDAFFPIALLHLGHWNNIAWGWQLQFTVSVSLTLGLVMAIVLSPTVKPLQAAVILGCFLTLPFTGANGLLTVLVLTPWAVFAGVRQFRAVPRTSLRTAGALLITAAIAVVPLLMLYFWGYTRQGSYVPNPGARKTIETTLRLVAYAWGPAVWYGWSAGTIGALIVNAATAAVLGVAWWRVDRTERARLVGVASAFCASLAVVAALAWGRAGWVPAFGYPARYVLLVTPTLVIAYLVWELYAPRRPSAAVCLILFITMAALVPANARAGYEGFGRWYVQNSAAVERDVAQGATAEQIAARHHAFLLHWDQDGLLEYLRILRDARLTVFRNVQ
jgi:hypothetical protein